MPQGFRGIAGPERSASEPPEGGRLDGGIVGCPCASQRLLARVPRLLDRDGRGPVHPGPRLDLPDLGLDLSGLGQGAPRNVRVAPGETERLLAVPQGIREVSSLAPALCHV